MTQPSAGQISTLRIMAIVGGVLLFISDYGVDAWAKPVPVQAYLLVGAVALGVEAGTLRKIVIKALQAVVGGNGR